MAVVSLRRNRQDSEASRNFVHIWCNVHTLVWEPRVLPSPRQGFHREYLNVQPPRIAWYERIGRVIRLFVQKSCRGLLDNFRCDERTVGSYAYDRRSLDLFCRTIVSIEYIIFAAAKACCRKPPALINNRQIGCRLRRRHYDIVQGSRPPHTSNDTRQRCLTT